jgi:inorganic pyrophosphatase
VQRLRVRLIDRVCGLKLPQSAQRILPVEKLQLQVDLWISRVQQIQHFFEHYKDLEKGKWVKIEGWEGPEAAKEEIVNGVAAYKAKEQQ